ncbi:MAG: hypothetical protein WBM04_07765 [Candidatus Korobacteraceae bacterium]
MPLRLFPRLALSIIFLLAVGCAAQDIPFNVGHAEQDTRAEQVRALVSQYCRLDYSGARLDQQGWTKLESLVWWKTNPDYQQIDVISRYTVETAPVLTNGRYSVTVHYRRLGRYEPGIGYSRIMASPTEDVEYTVTAVKDEWRIDDAEPNFPHPSQAAMVKWLTAQISSTQDASAKSIYEEALRQLQAPSAPPPAH